MACVFGELGSTLRPDSASSLSVPMALLLVVELLQPCTPAQRGGLFYSLPYSSIGAKRPRNFSGIFAPTVSASARSLRRFLNDFTISS